ncbi:MAG: hypothetical protein H7124_08095 [Phycisphaerales bacterium]|nr:hypothetical protein [Hyphomonadaceae bacterium]
MSNAPDQPPPISYPSLERVVELAREMLREQGRSEDEIAALLSRTRAPEYAKAPDR